MPKTNFVHSQEMLEHISSFARYKQLSYSEAIRQLILDGFAANGCPLDDRIKLIAGRKKENADPSIVGTQSVGRPRKVEEALPMLAPGAIVYGPTRDQLGDKQDYEEFYLQNPFFTKPEE